MKNLLRYQIPPVIWVIITYVLSATPSIWLDFKATPGGDKIVHAIFFFILCWLVWRAFYYQGIFPMMRNSALLGAFIFCFAYSFLDEFHQTFVPGRDLDVYDLVADTGGALLFIAIAWLWRHHHTGDEENPES